MLRKDFGEKVGQKQESPLYVASMLAILLGVALVAMAGRGCQVEDFQARKALQKSGYTHIKLGYRSNWLAGLQGCDKFDAVIWKASAKDRRGKRQDMTVCAGWPLKDAAVKTP